MNSPARHPSTITTPTTTTTTCAAIPHPIVMVHITSSRTADMPTIRSFGQVGVFTPGLAIAHLGGERLVRHICWVIVGPVPV